MKRYPAFEFPEYVNWTSTPESEEAYRQQAQDPRWGTCIQNLDETVLIRLYRHLVTARLHDIQLKRWVKQGVITKAWLGSGEEAITVGMCAALEHNDVVGPMIRNASALISRGMPLETCFAAYLGTTDTLSRGRDLHIGDLEYGVIPPISHVGDLVPVMAGCALSFKLKKQASVALTWTGDGATATGIFHEGMRVASALNAPLISVIQDNKVALGTLNTNHHRGHFKGFGEVYGLRTWEVDGNHVLACYAAANQARQWCLEGKGPALIIARTFRMGGHATHDEKEARQLFSDEVYRQWGQRDPIGCYEQWLIKDKGINPSILEEIEVELTQSVDQAARYAQSRKTSHAPDPKTQQSGVYARPL